MIDEWQPIESLRDEFLEELHEELELWKYRRFGTRAE